RRRRGHEGDHRRRATPRWLRVRQGPPGGAHVPRRQDHPDLRGHQPDPAHGDRPPDLRPLTTGSRIRSRFAPAPSGRKHIGNYRTALFSWLFARSQGGEFVLRIEDTDKERADLAEVAAIVDLLGWMGIDWDDGPVLQSERAPEHADAARRLEMSGAAYRCWCSPSEVEEMRRVARAEGRPPLYDRRCRNRTEPGEGPSVLRFAVPLEGATSFVDLVHGDITVENSNLNDLVLLRSDGSAVYLLANVVDDMADGITHILRADDLLAATPIQILIAAALDRLEPAVYGHLPVVVGPDRAKLSTRHGPVSVVDFREDGISS